MWGAEETQLGGTNSADGFAKIAGFGARDATERSLMRMMMRSADYFVRISTIHCTQKRRSVHVSEACDLLPPRSDNRLTAVSPNKPEAAGSQLLLRFHNFHLLSAINSSSFHQDLSSDPPLHDFHAFPLQSISPSETNASAPTSIPRFPWLLFTVNFSFLH